jgi:nitrate reductase delta subunit
MRLYQLLADVVDYPGPELSRRIDDCATFLSPLCQEAAGLLEEFRTFLGKIPPETMEEIYTKTFDLDVVCYPYVGYHLFGDGNHRGMFLAGLKEHYQICGFSTGNELPDHLSVMLRFLARDEDREERDELLGLCILPALRKMVEGFRDETNPYQKLLRAILLLLQEGEDAMNDMDHGINRRMEMEELCDDR